jgi:arylsulfatase A-like enzyme
MSGKRPGTTACYQNADNWKEYIPEGIGLAATFKNAGYYVVGAGKIYHSSTCYPGEWEDYFDEKGFGSEDDEEVRAARARSKSMGKLEGFHTEVTHDLKDSDLSDWHIVDYCVDQLRKPHDKPFFLACGVHKPHLPWVVPGLTEPDTLCDRTVDFMSIYPTLCELAGISVPSHVEGVSIRRLLEDSQAPWDQPGVTTFGYVNHAVRSEAWRYIRYSGGGEEFYDEARDPYEWTNRADSAEFERQKAELGKFMPTVNTPARGKSKAKAISPDAKAKQKKANK